MKVVEYRSMLDVRGVMQELKPLHGFQTWGVLCKIERMARLSYWIGLLCRPWRILRLRRWRVIVVQTVDGRPVLLAPLEIYRGDAYVSCASGYVDYVDVVYADLGSDVLSQAFDVLMKHLARRFRHLVVRRLDPKSQTYRFAQKYPFECRSEFHGAKIALAFSSHAEYFASLSKHVRQNVRTAYNRLTRDGHAVSFLFYSMCGVGKDLGSAEARELFGRCDDLECQRVSLRYGHAYGVKGRLTHRHLDYITTSAFTDESVLAVVLIDGIVAAYMQGYFGDSGQAIELPRLAIADEFGWYSPGLILLNETAKFFFEKTNVRMVDLCEGSEKYKFDMGGARYDTKTIAIQTYGQN